MDARKAAALARGIRVFAGLLVLTVVEYGIAVGMTGNLAPLAVVALLKAGLIVEYFMHLSQLWHPEHEEG